MAVKGNKMTRLLAIDPGTYRCGYAVFNDGYPTEAGTLEVKGELEQRIANLVARLEAVAAQLEVQEIACEKAWGRNFRPAPELEAFIRRLRRWARGKRLAFHLYNTQSVYGGKWPREVIRAGIRQVLLTHWPREIKLGDDALDAVAIGYYHVGRVRLIELGGNSGTQVPLG